ncbi:hypothetical protein [Bacillus sp. AFS075034]|uniref:hypothetical protein n=1 Tax=Bacillus sp. AFS075034 TaxID=2034281 RepID=UPI0020D27413|nr:hypothetical protein [Bacillus sp. AFS075034]
MSNVIKRRHTSQYSQIHNNPLQNDLEDLRSLGLLSYLMSLPADWTIYKTQLHKKFSRKNADAAWKELAEKNYAIGFAAYINGKKQHFYNVSDIPFTSEEFFEFVRDTVNELRDQGFVVKSLLSMMHGSLAITEEITNVLSAQQSETSTNLTDAPRVQYNEFSTNGAYTKEIYTNEKITNKHNIKDIDDDKANFVQLIYTEEELHNIIEGLREATKNELTKRSFDAVVRKVVDKLNQKKIKTSFRDYLVTSLNTKIEELELRRVKDKAKEAIRDARENKKLTAYTGQVPIYNWLEEDK